MLYFTPILLLIGVGILAALLVFYWRQKRSLSYLICFSIFWAYLLFLMKVTLFPIPLHVAGAWLPKERLPFILTHVNLIPFNYIGFFNKYIVLLEILQNVFLTMPFGFGINFIARVKPNNFLRLGVMVGSTIEAAQLMISLAIGGVYRAVDITDILLNTVGVLLGYGIFKMFARSYLRFTQLPNIKGMNFLEYIYHITNQGVTEAASFD